MKLRSGPCDDVLPLLEDLRSQRKLILKGGGGRLSRLQTLRAFLRLNAHWILVAPRETSMATDVSLSITSQKIDFDNHETERPEGLQMLSDLLVKHFQIG
jgi:hypothetical protein